MRSKGCPRRQNANTLASGVALAPRDSFSDCGELRALTRPSSPKSAMSKIMNLRLTVMCVMAASLLAGPTPKAPRALPLQESLEKARVDGKYAMLLRQFKVEKDFEKYGAFRDVGRRATMDYPDFTGLPAGHWVYVYPYWYIWRDLAEKPAPKRGWGPEQATGPPDTPGAGDFTSAWASLLPAGQDEWLLLEYAQPVLPSAVLVHETYNPGALVRVTAFKLDGEEVEVWKGKDQTAQGAGRGVSEIAVDVEFKTNRVKLYLDSKAVPGWNEIDAVGLRDSGGKTHWATGADASSTYAEQGGGVIVVFPFPAAAPLPAPAPPVGALPLPPPPVVVVPVAPANAKDKRIKNLEQENKELKEELKKLQHQIKKEGLKGEPGA